MTVDPAPPFVLDPRLKDYVNTDHQRETIDLINEYGGVSQACVARGIGERSVRRWLAALKIKAAQQGYAPECGLTRAIPVGYIGKGHSTLDRINPDGTRTPVLQWTKSRADDDVREALFMARVEGLKDDMPKADPVPAPASCNDDLLTVYPWGDPHAGLYAWAAETGNAFDLAEFERINVAAIDQVVAAAPASATALFIDLGDSTDSDNSTNRTPKSGHVLHGHPRHSEVIRVVQKLKRYQVHRLLQKHAKGIYRTNPGTHDGATALSISLLLEAMFENEPRITVDVSPNPYWYLVFGSNLIGTTHGDGAKGKDLPLLMAVDCPQGWAASEHGYRVWFVGHVHHKDVKDYPGVTVEYHRTLAAQNLWSHASGHRSRQSIEAVTFHLTDGEETRATIGMSKIKRVLAA